RVCHSATRTCLGNRVADASEAAHRGVGPVCTMCPTCINGLSDRKVCVTDTLIEAAADEAVTLTSELIRIDTTNTGDPDTLVGEQAAAEYVAEKLTEVGYEIEYVESGGANRHNVIARLPGADPSRGALLVHGHLDVVPADPAEWS